MSETGSRGGKPASGSSRGSSRGSGGPSKPMTTTGSNGSNGSNGAAPASPTPTNPGQNASAAKKSAPAKAAPAKAAPAKSTPAKPAAKSAPTKSTPTNPRGATPPPARPSDTQPVRTQPRPPSNPGSGGNSGNSAAAADDTTTQIRPVAARTPSAPAQKQPTTARPAQPTPKSTPQSSPQPATPQGRQPVSPQPARPTPGVQTTTDQPAARSDAPARPALKDRVGAKLSKAADEHRANAGATVTPAASVKPEKPQPRRARLRLVRVDPWSVMKVSFLLSIAFAIVTVVAVMIVWGTLGAAGVWDSINASVQSVIGGQESENFDVTDYVGMSRILGFTMLVAVVDVILITALATLGAFLYNMSAALLGGLELTLAEDPR